MHEAAIHFAVDVATVTLLAGIAFQAGKVMQRLTDVEHEVRDIRDMVRKDIKARNHGG